MQKAIVALAIAAFASTASATIAGGSHDLSATGLNPAYRGTLSSCQYCHAPHNTNSVGGAPLWNRNLPVASSFALYTSNTLTAAVVLGVNSLTCLSCHDGATAMGSTFKGSPGGVNALANTSYAFIGTNLADDHPVGVLYTGGALGTTGWKSESAVGGVGLKLYAGQGGVTVECASCHEPHGDSDGATGGVGSGFLRVAIGELCSGCHTK
jgi:predicted CXXCH cytochrome family protein